MLKVEVYPLLNKSIKTYQYWYQPKKDACSGINSEDNCRDGGRYMCACVCVCVCVCVFLESVLPPPTPSEVRVWLGGGWQVWRGGVLMQRHKCGSPLLRCNHISPEVSILEAPRSPRS